MLHFAAGCLPNLINANLLQSIKHTVKHYDLSFFLQYIITFILFILSATRQKRFLGVIAKALVYSLVDFVVCELLCKNGMFLW